MFDPRLEQSVATVLAKRAARHPDKTWIIAEGRDWSYAEMERRALRLARGLAAQGVKAGDTVLLMLPDGIEIITCWLALARLGALEVPVNTQLRGTVLRHVLADSRASLIILDPRFADRIAPLLPECPRLAHIVLSREPTQSDPPLAAFAQGAPQITPLASLFHDDGALPEPPRAFDLAAVMYTSGTTGPSKGVMITHMHSYEYALSVVELLKMREDDVYYNPLPLFHIAGQWAAVYACLIRGATVVIPGAFSLAGFWPDVAKHRATCTFLLGAMANWLWRQPQSPADAETPMERMLIVPLLAEVEAFKTRFGVLVSTTWGSTEINVPTRSSFTLASNKTCGRVAEDRFEVRIVDENDMEVPPGVPGEALVRTKEPWLLMAGYWNNPEATAKALRNQWVHSGDMLIKDEAGNLTFVDRTKDAIRRRGENISSMEVEAEVLAHESVLECAVIPVASADSEQEVMAVVVPKPRARIEPEALIRFLEPRMARFAVPRYVDIIAEMPKTPTGKIQKYVLRERGLTESTWDREQAGVRLKR